MIESLTSHTMLAVLASAAIALGWALLVCHWAMPLAKRFHLLDIPHLAGGRKRHDRPTPLVGGIATIPPLIAALIATSLLTAIDGVLHHRVDWLAALTALFLTVGLLDDRIDLSARLRIVVAALAFTITAITVPDFGLSFLLFSTDTVVFLPPVAGVALTVICLVGLLNAINMADGKNGLVVGLSIIWSLLLLAYAPPHLQPALIGLIVGLLVVLRYNLASRLFLGDGGSYGLSAFFGLAAIYVYNQRFHELSAEHLLLWFSVPVMDCLRLIVWRMAQGRSPFQGDREHLHHYMAMVFTWDRGKYLYWALVAVPGFVSVVMPQAVQMLLFLSIVLYVSSIVLLRQRIASDRMPAE